MNIVIAIIIVVVVYLYIIKLVGIISFISEVSPYLGGVLNTATYYSGADSFYNFLVSKGFYGEDKKQDELEREFIILNNELEGDNNFLISIGDKCKNKNLI